MLQKLASSTPVSLRGAVCKGTWSVFHAPPVSFTHDEQAKLIPFVPLSSESDEKNQARPKSELHLPVVVANNVV